MVLQATLTPKRRNSITCDIFHFHDIFCVSPRSSDDRIQKVCVCICINALLITLSEYLNLVQAGKTPHHQFSEYGNSRERIFSFQGKALWERRVSFLSPNKYGCKSMKQELQLSRKRIFLQFSFTDSKTTMEVSIYYAVFSTKISCAFAYSFESFVYIVYLTRNASLRWFTHIPAPPLSTWKTD